MATLPFQQVDVFTSVPFRGNPVAVVFDGDRFTTEEAQAIAAWTNLSETTFVCRPTHRDADYRLRIFTPRAELPFAGHPTIGSAHAVLRAGFQPRNPGLLVQECRQGLVRLRTEGEQVFLALPERKYTAPSAQAQGAMAGALGLDPVRIVNSAVIDVGPVWFTLRLTDAATVLKLIPDLDAVVAASPPGVTGVTVFGAWPGGTTPDGTVAQVEVRSFAPAHGVAEDPVCGSGNGCVAAMIQKEAGAGPGPGSRVPLRGYVATQGRRVGRDGRVHVAFDPDGTIWLGGSAVTCIEGRIAG